MVYKRFAKIFNGCCILEIVEIPSRFEVVQRALMSREDTMDLLDETISLHENQRVEWVTFELKETNGQSRTTGELYEKDFTLGWASTLSLDAFCTLALEWYTALVNPLEIKHYHGINFIGDTPTVTTIDARGVRSTSPSVHPHASPAEALSSLFQIPEAAFPLDALSSGEIPNLVPEETAILQVNTPAFNLEYYCKPFLFPPQHVDIQSVYNLGKRIAREFIETTPLGYGATEFHELKLHLGVLLGRYPMHPKDKD